MSFDVKPWQPARVRGARERGREGRGGSGCLEDKQQERKSTAQQMKGSRKRKSLLLLEADPDAETWN